MSDDRRPGRDASATEMSARGERNVGEQCRREYGGEAYALFDECCWIDEMHAATPLEARPEGRVPTTWSLGV